MLRITCPHCGERDQSEFRYGGDASKPRPPHGSTDRDAWHDFVFVFDNPKGWHTEYWQHVLGCRRWLVAERHTVTHEIRAIQAARERTGGP
jgi:sarcosine oxidase subunit delta